MLLWITLAILQAEKQFRLTPKKLKVLIRGLPYGLNSLYDKLLTKINDGCNDEDEMEFIQRVIKWVTLSERPLTLRELRMATSLELDTKSLKEVQLPRNIRQDLSILGSFIDIVPSSRPENIDPSQDRQEVEELRHSDSEDGLEDTVRLIHQSAKDYLLGISDDMLYKFRIDIQKGHSELAQTCLTYLMLEEFGVGAMDPIHTAREVDEEEAIALQPFLERRVAENDLIHYASLKWADHVRACCNDSDRASNSVAVRYAVDYMSKFPQNLAYACQISLYIRSPSSTCIKRTALHEAVRQMLYPVACQLLDDGHDTNARDQEKNTPLHWFFICMLPTTATPEKILRLAQLLVGHGADIHAKGDNGFPVLSLAAIGGRLDFVRFILESDRGTALSVGVNAMGKCGFQPIHFASFEGRVDALKFLLDSGADVNAAGNDSYQSIHIAAQEGHVDVLKLLLDSGADINAASDNDKNPLYWAAKEGHLNTVRYLIDRGAGVDFCEMVEHKWTALCIAAYNGHLETVKCLVDAGAKINIVTDDHWSPLKLARFRRRASVVEYLLSCGAEEP